MDLISREAVDNAMYDYCHSCDVNESQMENYFCDLPSAFEGMTNGDIFTTIYPDYETEKVGLCMMLRPKGKKGIANAEVLVDLDFWNAPYKKGGEL